MEIARMNYYFTGVLIVLFVLLCFIKPAHPRNEYLNNGTNTCSTGDLYNTPKPLAPPPSLFIKSYQLLSLMVSARP